jgi:hypothetical protein
MIMVPRLTGHKERGIPRRCLGHERCPRSWAECNASVAHFLTSGWAHAVDALGDQMTPKPRRNLACSRRRAQDKQSSSTFVERWARCQCMNFKHRLLIGMHSPQSGNGPRQSFCTADHFDSFFADFLHPACCSYGGLGPGARAKCSGDITAHRALLVIANHSGPSLCKRITHAL